MDCHDCGSSDAIIHLTEIIDGQTRSIWLCPRCSLRRQSDQRDPDNDPASLASFLGELWRQEGEAPLDPAKVVCPACDYTLEKWQQTNLLGCPRCYRAFSGALVPHLSRFHGHASHFGKTPRHRTEDPDQLAAIKRARLALEKAVAREDFEEAARLRDLLVMLKTGAGQGS